MTSIIDNYAALPLGVYLDILAAQRDIPEDLDRQVRVVSLLSGLTEREVLNLPIAEYREMAGKTLFLTEAPTRYPSPRRKYKCGEWVLVPTLDLARVTTAQYIDFQTFAPEGEARLAETLSCFLVPEGCEYNDGYDVAEVQRAVRDNLSTADALGLMAFFLSRLAALIRTTRTYLSRQRRRRMTPEMEAKAGMLTEALEALRIAGDGLRM